MSTTRPAQLVVAIFAALAMMFLLNARVAFAQDAADGTSVDPNWASTAPATGPAIDEDAASADKVLEIPQAPCTKDGASVPCDGTVANNDSPDDGQTINAPSPGAPPTLDDDTASSGAPDPDWGNVNDYQNQPAYGVPYYPVYPYSVAAAGTTRTPSPVPPSAYAPMSSPITQAARPPLNPGPWMNSPMMSAFGRPAGSSMQMARPAWGFNH